MLREKRLGNDDTAANRERSQPRADETNGERSGHHKVGVRGVVAKARFEHKLERGGRTKGEKKNEFK